MAYQLVLMEKAVIEINESYHWYEAQSTSIGILFLKALDKSFDVIKQYPRQCELRYKKFREFYFGRFPFIIVFYVDEPHLQVVVISIFHCSRNPRQKYR